METRTERKIICKQNTDLCHIGYKEENGRCLTDGTQLPSMQHIQPPSSHLSKPSYTYRKQFLTITLQPDGDWAATIRKTFLIKDHSTVLETKLHRPGERQQEQRDEYWILLSHDIEEKDKGLIRKGQETGLCFASSVEQIHFYLIKMSQRDWPKGSITFNSLHLCKQ